MNLIVQRFPIGHVFYSEAIDRHEHCEYEAIFGQMYSEDIKFVCYTMERKDTLIAEGSYKFTYYKSPVNRMVVLLLHDVPGYEFIEVHIANYPHEIKGCTAVGTTIDVAKPMLIGSGRAFAKLMDLLDMEAGTITYTTINNLA